jgi:alkanesulfonate monooxygenase SsuD/methylene tetrahydromethanopterin reductase-like flavin-dependent oxidoreductase (luciferase family)
MQKAAEHHGELPPIVLATLRRKMVELSVEIGAGAVWANASRNDFNNSVADIPKDVQTSDFLIGNMIPTVIDADREAGAARNRKTLQGYVSLPNYRNYWKQAGYVEEMEGIEAAIADGDRDRVATCMTDEWLSNATLYGSADQVRDGVEEWFDQGCKTPILVPSSTSGGQMHAIQEIFDCFA